MNNCNFLSVIGKSFEVYLSTHPRSNKKLEILHGKIAEDLSNKLGDEYNVYSLGYKEGKERKIKGRYIDKNVDITITNQNNEAIAGIAVKFVMSNYSQNSNNYFENMLGETANVRSGNKAYFQIFIISDEMPYYNNDGEITKWEEITTHNIDKYIKLSKDNVDIYFHTPLKTLFYLIKFPTCDRNIVNNKAKYKKFYLNNIEPKVSSKELGTYGSNMICNDYEKYIKKITHYIKSI